ncbi:hypothetical protein G5Y08_004236 [Vibrio parahaemolyticus]|nr:hypothetical protein [Vibrio parahaemolyticus]EHD2277592.1 hypothetical protein [Vibrio parahaemolyticus]EHH2498325.1 hypothetical protein [Vibrio parahaemolyticus]EID4328226.1 hypothetical protein [Vibrio parahaemolyticus]
MSRCTCTNAPGGVSCESNQMAVCVSQFGICEASCVTLTQEATHAIQSGGNYVELIEEVLNQHFGMTHQIHTFNETNGEINLIYKRIDGAIVNVSINRDENNSNSNSELESARVYIDEVKHFQEGEG